MRSPLTKLAVAAAVAVACLIGVSLWRQTGSGIALADVLARMEQIQVYRLQMSTTFTNADMQDKPVSQATMLVSGDLGQKTTIQLDHPITGQRMLQEIYVLPSQGTITTLMPNEKKYSKVELDQASIERWQSESDPRRIVEQVLQCQHTSLGRSTVDGVEVEGFQTTDPSCLGETSMAGADITIWANVETKLPVRIEIEKGREDVVHMKITASDFEWNVSVDPAEFEPVIPDDYTPGQPMMQIGPRK